MQKAFDVDYRGLACLANHLNKSVVNLVKKVYVSREVIKKGKVISFPATTVGAVKILKVTTVETMYENKTFQFPSSVQMVSAFL